MLISLEWLNEFVDIKDLSPEEIDISVKRLCETKFYLNCFFGQTPISCLTPLYPMPFTTLLEKIHSDKLYDESKAYKYKFKNETVESYYTFLQTWAEVVYEKYTTIDRAYVELSFEEFEKIEYERKRLSDLLKLDLEFIVASQPINNLNDDEQQMLFNAYVNKIKDI